MKTLLMLRHGKAEDRALTGGDKMRRLKMRGERDAEEMGTLVGRVARPDLVVSSDALRAWQTAEIASAAFGYTGEIVKEPLIYEAEVDTLFDLVRHLPESADCVLMVGHNPGFEYVSYELSDDDTPIYLSTACVAHIEFDVEHWRDVRRNSGHLRGVYSPRDEQ